MAAVEWEATQAEPERLARVAKVTAEQATRRASGASPGPFLCPVVSESRRRLIGRLRGAVALTARTRW